MKMPRSGKRTCGRKPVIAALDRETKASLGQPEDVEDAHEEGLASTELVLERQVRLSQKALLLTGRGGKEILTDGRVWPNAQRSEGS